MEQAPLMPHLAGEQVRVEASASPPQAMPPAALLQSPRAAPSQSALPQAARQPRRSASLEVSCVYTSQPAMPLLQSLP